MDEEVRKKLEYEEQFFGMSSRFFADSFKNFVRDELDSKIAMLVKDIRDKIIKQAQNPEEFEESLQVMKEQLTQKYRKSLKNSFPEIQSRISNYIDVPKNVLLEEDLPVRKGIDGNINEIKEEIENLKGTFKSLLYLKQKMLKELQEADSIIFYMENAINKKKSNFEIMPVEEICALSKANISLFEEGNV